ncbi:hypothetical protein PVNG_05399 [Plasmodium vivax North Korean]|uniref:VIR protein n=1 Tax=Plasmodium vivax North Korean TaxID=1035514 RepID=A0A0J9TW53_PLAVI|nr:hypothetical protein PVNG_05399 [Plasmodium vivax North Korean]
MKILKENNKCFKGGKKNCIENFNIVFNTQVLRNKKLLHDFVVHYDNIKNILNDAKHTNKEIYCEYVKHYFELYKKMKKESPLDLTEHYGEEIKNFEEKFKNGSLSFLDEKCPQNGIKSLFKAANVTRGPLKQLSNEVIEPIIGPLKNEKEIKENILKGLPSDTIYEEFNKTDNISNYESVCKGHFGSENKKEELNKFCKTLYRNLKEKKYISNNKDKLEENRCSYLIYWAGDQLRSIFSDSSKYNNFIDDLNEINKILLSINNDDVAGKYCYFYIDGNFSLWNEEKYLHDYFKNHGSIKTKYYYNEKEKKMYCDYLDYVKKLYEKYIWNCCRYFYRGKPWNLCSRYFECDKVYNPFELLSKFKCGSEIKDKNELAGESVQRIYEALIIDRDIIIQSQVKTHNKFLFDPFNKFVTASFTILGTLSVLFVLYKDDILNELPVNKIYEEFKKVNGTNKYSNICTLEKPLKDNYKDFGEICEHFAYNLDRILSNEYNEKKIERCILLKYWIYDKLKNKYGTDNKIKVLPLTEQLKKLQYNIKDEKSVKFDCYDDYNDYMSKWEVERDLFEYFINFDEIKKRDNLASEEDKKYIQYVQYIKTLYDEKIDKEHCCDLDYRHLYDHYFDCNPKYDPNHLLLKFKDIEKMPEKEVEVKEDKKTSSEKGASVNFSTEALYTPDIVIPNVSRGWNKRRNKLRTKLHNVKCIVNYADRKDGYALVSCYNPGKKYPNVENIFRPTVEEDKFFDENKKEKGRDRSRETTRGDSQDSVRSTPGVTETSAEGPNQDGNSATPKSKIHDGIPEYLQGYSLLGEYIKERRNDTYGSYQPGREAAFTYSGSGRRFIPGVDETKVGWTYTKLENGKVTSVDEKVVEKYEIPVNGGGQNEGTTSTMTKSPTLEFSNTELPDGLEPTEVSMFKTPMFRGSTLAVLLVGIVFVFFIYYKVYDNYKMYLAMQREFEQNAQMEYIEAPPRRDVPKRSAQAPRSKKKAPPREREDESKKVELDVMYKEFFSKEETPQNKNYCDTTDSKIQNNSKEKQLCSKLVYHLEKIKKEQKPNNQADYCSYLRYWLYDKIGEIHKEHSAKTSTIHFFKYLIDAWSKVNSAKLSNICAPPKVENVTLKELKDRKYTYIYFKNLDKIHKVSTSKNTADCSKYLTYLQSLSSLHEKYRQNQCVYILWAPDPVDYFPCSNKDKLSYLTSGLQNCKDGKEPYSTPQTSSALTTSRSGTGASTSLSAKTGSAGARGLPGSSGTGGTARAPALAAAPVQAKPASTLGQGQANRAQLSTAQPSVGGALTQLGGRTAQLAQSPPGGGSETLIANGDMVTALTGVAPASSGFSEKASEMLKSDYFRHTLVGATVFSVLAFVFFFFKVKIDL